MISSKVIRENNKILDYYNKSISHKLLASNDRDNYEYIDAFCQKLYWQINETIIALDLKKYTIIEQDTLEKHFETLLKLYFDSIRADIDYTFWQHSERQAQSFFSHEYTYIEPADFTREYLYNLSHKILRRKPKANNTKNTWFQVALQFANGTIYNEFNNGKGIKGTVLKNNLFGKDAPDKYRQYIDCTLNHNKGANKQKNIFARSKAEIELKEVVEHCKKNNIKIHINFKEDCSKYELDINFEI